MTAFFKKVFGNTDSESNEIDTISQFDRIRIATCALLVEIASVDDEFSDMERNKILEILKKKFQLTDEEAVELIDIANKEIQKAIDLYGFAKIIKDHYDIDERVKVIEEIWKIIFIDNELVGHEDALVRKLSFILGLTHKQLIDAKLKVLGKK